MTCLAITGPPGSGKSTLARRIAEELRRRGLRVCGISCPDVREGGRRVGFVVEDLESGERAWLARVSGCSGPRVGRYRLCPEAEDLAVKALSKDCDVYLIDEIGPMELRLPRLREAMLRALRSGRPFIAVHHLKLRDPDFLEALRGCERVLVTREGREESWERALAWLSRFSS
ncbi:MAG: AAA family ATPase [Crenarchaeota archaeon]|nr:AAA family ATPase [Thermoproteota archaeon]